MKETSGHIARLWVRSVLGRSLRLLRTCRALTCRRLAMMSTGDPALEVLRLLAVRIRGAARGRPSGCRRQRRFMSVVDALVAATSARLVLTPDETSLLRRAWDEYLAGDDPAGTVRLLLASFRQGRSEDGGPASPHEPDLRDDGHDALWQSRLMAFVMDDLSGGHDPFPAGHGAGVGPLPAPAARPWHPAPRGRGPPAATTLPCLRQKEPGDDRLHDIPMKTTSRSTKILRFRSISPRFAASEVERAKPDLRIDFPQLQWVNSNIVFLPLIY